MPKKKTKKIVVTAYNPDWPKIFDAEALKIKEALGPNCIAIHHIGSTSVPGLSAKPVIDMIGVVKDPEKAIQPLQNLGFKYKGEYNIPMRFYFNRSEGVDTNLHVYEEEHPEIELNLLFRDYLRGHSEAREEYAILKENLLKEKSSYEKNSSGFTRISHKILDEDGQDVTTDLPTMGREHCPRDKARPIEGKDGVTNCSDSPRVCEKSGFTGYNLGKDAFIRKILKAAHFNRIRIMKCNHFAEWEAAKRLRQKYFFDPLSLEDPYTWTFNHKEHARLILYKGMEIIGYAHIQFWPDYRAALRIIVIDEPYRHHGLGSQFLHLCEQWLKKQGVKSLHDEARPEAIKFYRNNGYREMPFNDPSGEPPSIHDLAMGKVL